MKTDTGKLLLQITDVWIILSGCFPCCDTDHSRMTSDMELTLTKLTKPKEDSLSGPVSTFTEQRLAVHKQYFEITSKYAQSIQSTEAIQELGV